ncbi:gelsolin, putative [Schistosoma mansoni]|nr:gelsolin, putative [Schistosoma mansoni]|eukprot:XP_018647212.1 gelsolin, putative [Schistosoma mansoni]
MDCASIQQYLLKSVSLFYTALRCLLTLRLV